jgi:LHFPL tetraspan subfamily member protein
MDSASIHSFYTIHTNYIRNSRAIAVLWAVFTICFCIINIVVFMQPWLGDTELTEKEGYFGLYEACKYEITNYQVVGATPQVRSESKLVCEGSWTALATAVNPIATFFVGFSCLMNLLCIAVFLVLFLFISPPIIFTICGALQLISSKFYFIFIFEYNSVFLFT